MALGTLPLLPNEILFGICFFLTVEERCRFSQVCKVLNNLFTSDEVLNREKWDYRVSKGCFTTRTFSMGRPSPSLQFANNYLFLGETTGRITVFGGAPNWEERAVLMGHVNNVSCMHVDRERIYSGSSDKTIQIRNVRTFERLAVFTHGDAITCMHATDKYLYSASGKTIKIWDLNTARVKTSLEVDGQPQNLTVEKDTLFFRSSDSCDIQAVNLNTNNRKVLKGHLKSVTCLLVMQDRLFSGSSDKTIRIWNVNSMECHNTKCGFAGTIFSLQALGSYLISSNATGIDIFNPKTMECIHSVKDKVTPFLQVTEGQLCYSTGRDIKILDFST
jgi:WD40 repeat protein